MTFKEHVKQILHTEISKVLEQQEYFLESQFCNMVSKKYGFRISSIRVILRDVYPELSLIKRRLSDELKGFYGLEIKGHPIMYVYDSNIGNC